MDKKQLFTMILLAATTLFAGAQVRIGGHLAVMDSLTNTCICPIAHEAFGTDLTTTVTFGTDSAAFAIIDNDSVPQGGNYTFTNITGGKKWTMAIDGNRFDLTFTYLPVMVMEGTFGYEYVQGTVMVLEPDRYNETVMPARVKWRGATTNIDGRNKRNYHIKFVDGDGNKTDRSFMGLRKDNSWIMDAGQVDFARIRNRVATELWGDMCRPPYYADQEPKAKSYVDGGMVEVILNGKYAGCYALTEAMDRKQMKLKKFNENTGEIHGQLWKAKDLTNSTTFNIYKPFDNNSETWAGFETKYPELDEVAPTDYTALAEAVWFGDTCSFYDFNLKAEQYYDMPVMIDYNIFLQTLLGIDNYGKNIYWACYDRAVDPKVTLAVWDLDVSMGGNWTTKEVHPSTMSPTRNITFANGILGRICKPQTKFWQQSIDRYRQLRQDVLDPDSIKQRYIDAVNNIKLCGAMDREQNRWSRDTDLSGKPLDIEGELAYICDWIDKRIDFIDNNYFVEPLKGDVNNDKVVDIADINELINIILGYGNDGIMSNVSADVNHDEVVDIADVSTVINIMLHIK